MRQLNITEFPVAKGQFVLRFVIPTQLRIRALLCYAMLLAALSFTCVVESDCFACTHTVLIGEIIHWKICGWEGKRLQLSAF